MYTVRIPFLVPSTTRIDEHAALTTRAQITFTLKWEGYYHVLSAVGFGSHEEANAFLGTVRSAFAWLLLQKGIVAETNLVPQQIQYNTDPIKAGINQSRSFGNADLGPVDASIDGSQAAIFETLRSVQKFTGLPLSVSTTVRSDQALSVIIDGALLPPRQSI
ncbi:hypothetical protein [Candidatus Nitrotoga arctica]|uniref:Uncharacterized protein n=1 Tax=Candidatus Nitrotoga arctica TaxID=453162 RepID=A0ABN8AFN5_9PROT|nr:hypothetical protein [Candidatus Nitrotoga arctica]CAG9931530.1 protein of unknown function [Candidatus Nitrotoga arctica]